MVQLNSKRACCLPFLPRNPKLQTVIVSQLALWIFLQVQGRLSSALHELSCDCIEPIDKINGPYHDILNYEVFEAVLRLASSTWVKVPLAAPYCSKHTRATLGPKAVRTPDQPEGCLTNSLAQDIALQESAAAHDQSRIISDLVMV